MTKIMLKGNKTQYEISEQGIGLLSLVTIFPDWYIEVTEL